jgi:ribosome-associated protein
VNLDNEAPEGPSKSERKRLMLALQKLGEKLVNLSPDLLAKIPLEETLRTAILEARTITKHEAKRRQLQYVGRLMRDIDPVPIQSAIDILESKSNLSKAKFHQMERWRDTLIAEEDEAVQRFLEQYPDTDRQQLRQLVRNAKKALKGADTELFRYIRKIIETS